MPLVGYVCPVGTPTNEFQRPGQRNRVEHCLGVCPLPCVSPPLLAKMWEVERKNHHVGTYLSASMLTTEGCARQTWFERQPHIELYDIPRRRYWPFRGTIIHHMIEGVSAVVERYGWLQELRLTLPLRFPDLPAPIFGNDGTWTGEYDHTQSLEITLGGTTDSFNPYRRELHDYKTISDLKTETFLQANMGGTMHRHVKDAWVWQTNIYAWMLAQTVIPQDVRDRFAEYGLRALRMNTYPQIRTIRMQVLSMMELPLTGTKYVPMGRDQHMYELDDVPVLPHSQVEAYVREKALNWYRWLVLGEQPPVVEAARKWLCSNKNNQCPFNGEVHNEGVCFPARERELVTLQRAQSS